MRFHRDGTAQIIYDTVYDSVDVDDATWSQKDGNFFLKIRDDDRTYAGSVEHGSIRLMRVSASRVTAPSICTFRRSG